MSHQYMIKLVVIWLHILVASLLMSVYRTLASTNNELPEDGVTALKHVGAILM